MVSRPGIIGYYRTTPIIDREKFDSDEFSQKHRFVIISSEDFTGGHKLSLHVDDFPGPKDLGKKVRAAFKKGERWTSLVRVNAGGRKTFTVVKSDKVTSWQYWGEWETLSKAKRTREIEFAELCLPEIFGEK